MRCPRRLSYLFLVYIPHDAEKLQHRLTHVITSQRDHAAPLGSRALCHARRAQSRTSVAAGEVRHALPCTQGAVGQAGNSLAEASRPRGGKSSDAFADGLLCGRHSPYCPSPRGELHAGNRAPWGRAAAGCGRTRTGPLSVCFLTRRSFCRAIVLLDGCGLWPATLSV